MASRSTSYRTEQVRTYGRFCSAHSPLQLWEIVSEAIQKLCPGEPERLTQVLFNESRAAIDHPDAPSAKQIAARLGLPWPDLRCRAAESDASLIRLAQQVDKEPARELRERDIFFATSLVGLRLAQTDLTLDEYEFARRELIAEDQQHWKHGGLLEDLLPTGNQIVRAAGGWGVAMRIGQFEIRVPDSEWGGSVPIVDALDLHIQETGYSCGYKQLDRFARAHGFSLASRQPGRRWEAYLAELAIRYGARGTEVPPYPQPGTELKYDSTPFPNLPPRRRRNFWTLDKALDALVQYLERLRQDGQTKPSQLDYLARQKGNPAWPPPSILQRFGRFHNLIADARQRMARP